MSKSAVITIIVIVVILAGGGILLANHKINKNAPSTNSTNTSTAASSSGIKPVATNMVKIQNLAFSPANITITHGSTVTWTNDDSVAHTVTETDGQNGPHSGLVQPGKSFVFTFDKPGIYHYHCSIHHEMVGTVTVTN